MTVPSPRLPPRTLADVKPRLQRATSAPPHIRLSAVGEVNGGLRRAHPRTGCVPGDRQSLGIGSVSPWGRDVVTEAVQAITEYALCPIRSLRDRPTDLPRKLRLPACRESQLPSRRASPMHPLEDPTSARRGRLRLGIGAPIQRTCLWETQKDRPPTWLTTRTLAFCKSDRDTTAT